MLTLHYFRLFLAIIVTCLILSNVAEAQQKPGKLAGKITDEATNQSLSGVSIVIKSSKYGTSSTNDGSYTVALPAGTYTVSFSITGYAAKEITGIQIKENDVTYFNIVLSAASKELQNVVVTSTARRESQASVYNMQRRSVAASDGISIEAIQRTPDNNAGQIARRITGVSVQDNKFVVVRGLSEQYNQTILNGVPMPSTETDRNAFSLDLIPSVVIDNIVVNKTATADMPGNFAGGLVQVNTKEFPASDFISVSIQGSFYDKTVGKDFYSDKRGGSEWSGLSGKNRDLPKGFPQQTDRVPLVNMNNQERLRHLSSLKNNLSPVNYGPSGINHNLQIGLGKSYKFKNGDQLGIVVAINQRKSELIEQEVTARQPVGPGVGAVSDFIYLNYYSDNVRYNYESMLAGALNLSYRFGNNKLSFKNLYTNLFKNLFLDRPYANIESFGVLGIEPGTRVAGTSFVAEERKILSNVLSGEHRMGRNNDTRIDWNLHSATYNSELPDTRNFLYKKVDSTGHLIGNDNLGIAQAMSSQSRLWSENRDRIIGVSANLSTVFPVFKKKQLVKGGFFFQNRDRKANAVLIPYQQPEGVLDSLLSPSNVYLNGPLDITTSFASIASQVGNYNASSNMLAAYVHLESIVLEKLKVIAGLRAENYQQSVNVYSPYYFDGFADPDLLVGPFTSRNEYNLLPSINVVSNISDKVTLRAGYSATAIRPELKDLAPFISYDFKTLQVTQGNTELRSSAIKNLDLKFEYFPSAGEIISMAVFYKDITDPIEKVSGTDNDIAVRPVNTGKAVTRGIEWELRKKLNFFPFAAWMENIMVFGNASLINSKVNEGIVNNFFIDQVTEHKLSGQPDYIINAGFTASAFKKSFELTLSYNRSGDYINQLGTFNKAELTNGNITPTLPHYYIKSRDVLDLVLTQALLKNKARIKFNIGNLLEKPFIMYQDLNGNGHFDNPAQIDKSNTAVDYKIVSGQDNTPSYIIGQRYYSLSFSYTF